MNLRKALGLPERLKEGEQPKIMLSNVSLPIDLLLELIIRQQSQLYQENANINGRLAASEQIIAATMDQMEHLHGDVIELQQVLNQAGKHPVERIDEEAEVEEAAEKAKTKRELIH